MTAKTYDPRKVVPAILILLCEHDLSPCSIDMIAEDVKKWVMQYPFDFAYIKAAFALSEGEDE